MLVEVLLVDRGRKVKKVKLEQQDRQDLLVENLNTCILRVHIMVVTYTSFLVVWVNLDTLLLEATLVFVHHQNQHLHLHCSNPLLILSLIHI